MIAQESWIPISHRAVCMIMQHENMLLRVYQSALADQRCCPEEFWKILQIELSELRQDLQSVIN